MDTDFCLMFIAWLSMTCAWWDARLRAKRLERLYSAALDAITEISDDCIRRGNVILSLLTELDSSVEDELPESEE